MSWVVLAIAVGFWLRASVERAAVVRIRAEITDAKTRLETAVSKAERTRDTIHRVIVLPAPMPLVALAETECQGACALYSWLAIRGEGKA